MILFPRLLKERVNVLDKYLSATFTNPEWFADVPAAQEWLETEIVELDDEQLLAIYVRQEIARSNLRRGVKVDV